MDREKLRQMARRGQYIISRKVQGKLSLGKITHKQLEKTLIGGTETKREPDERTSGDYVKITLIWQECYLVVKSTDPCFIITAGRRE